MLRLFCIGILMIPSFCFGQIDSTSINYSLLVDSASIQIDVLALSTDSMLGRNTGDIGQKRAEDYIVSSFKSAGIKAAGTDDYLQHFDLLTNSLNSVSIQFQDSIISSEEALFSTAFNLDTSFTISNVVFAGYGISCKEYDDYKNIDVKDKMVFMYEENPVDINGNLIVSETEIKKWYNDDREAFAKSLGARGVVFVSTTYNSTRRYFDRYVKYRDVVLYDSSSLFPSFYMPTEVFYYLFDCDSVDVSRYLYKNKSKKTAKKFDKEVIMDFSIKSNRVKKVSSNVAAKIEGSDPNAPWIVLTAHYDHEGVRGDNIYNGADDNASGTAAVMAIAKAFKKAQEAGEVFTNNVLFLLVSGEEKGLLGSKYYVSDPLIPLDNTMCNLNIDMIGRTDKQHKLGDHYVYIIGSDRISTELHSVNESMNDLYMGLDLDYTYNALDDPNKFYERSDHYNFAKNGIPIIFYYNGTHEDYHKPTDTEDKIEYHLLVDRARLVFHTAWYLAKGEARMLN